MDAPVTLWKPEFQLNIDILDEQHKGFFDICRNAAMLCEAARTKPVQLDDVLKLVYGMRAYAFRHFHTEESLLLKHRYPKSYSHICLHDAFLRALQELTAELHVHFAAAQTAGSAAFLDCAQRITDYLTSWSHEHILTVDQDYADFLRERIEQTG